MLETGVNKAFAILEGLKLQVSTQSADVASADLVKLTRTFDPAKFSDVENLLKPGRFVFGAGHGYVRTDKLPGSCNIDSSSRVTRFSLQMQKDKYMS